MKRFKFIYNVSEREMIDLNMAGLEELRAIKFNRVGLEDSYPEDTDAKKAIKEKGFSKEIDAGKEIFPCIDIYELSDKKPSTETHSGRFCK